MTCGAAERLSIEGTLDRLPESVDWIHAILRRIARVSKIPRGARILEIGACQGRGLVALAQEGYEAYGIEPCGEAREIAITLKARFGVSFEIHDGVAETIPFPYGHFDVVIATSVMEHVTDLPQSLREIHRVLKPSVVFWFNSASAMCPVQDEIRGFPLFGWYPDSIKKRLMLWASTSHPELIGHTKVPALHWWTNRIARHRLRKAGFIRSWTRWELRLPHESPPFIKSSIAIISHSRTLQRLADTFIAGCSYAAQK